MTTDPIPFNRPAPAGNELRYVEEVLRSRHWSGDGGFTQRCSQLLEEELGASRVFLTTSCTHALEMAALLLDLEPGDEVIVPSYAFVTTASAFVLRGARPVFVDVRPDTLNLDETKLEAHITPRTKAIVVLHYAGVACEMDAILDCAARHGLQVVEDNAHGLFGTYRGRPLGTLSGLGTQSFHDTKNFTCGEGGALVLAERWVERAEILREKGTNRSRFFRGQVDKYTWVDLGSSYLPSELLAAMLLAQLEERRGIQARRATLWDRYRAELEAWAGAHDVGLPVVPEGCVHPHHVFYLMLPDEPRRAALIQHLRDRGVPSAFHYLPLHLSDMGRRFGGKPGDCPVTEDVSDRLLRLPLYHGLSDDEQTRVLEAVRSF